MTQPHLASADLAVLLTQLADRIPGAESAVLVTADGHTMASRGGGFPRTTGEISRLAATVRDVTLVKFDHDLLALAPAGPEAVLGVTLDGRTVLDSVLDSVLEATASAADHAGRVLAAHHIRTVIRTVPMQRRTGRHAADRHAAQLNFCDPSRPTEDQLERMLSRLRSL